MNAGTRRTDRPEGGHQPLKVVANIVGHQQLCKSIHREFGPLPSGFTSWLCCYRPSSTVASGSPPRSQAGTTTDRLPEWGTRCPATCTAPDFLLEVKLCKILHGARTALFIAAVYVVIIMRCLHKS